MDVPITISESSYHGCLDNDGCLDNAERLVLLPTNLSNSQNTEPIYHGCLDNGVTLSWMSR
ncbi:hypothetical protein Glaag_3298 [Glaciecola sp. 4H-3-7+YE-5]|nr:hypothetical protein Glaag_3298 [Glaciecola sp. 4H-3-7+YE-5]